ncbi:hypothetical protein CDAR_526951 [Caerostris darwini]|uniref:Uncharacterized protein n=1 Tax=Caerostris darwini TaxID=1538125 RepID=A0AAV4QYL2_9ARAC|nr:hypothetical protein CDAR_526951 [Caerostris darwini]
MLCEDQDIYVAAIFCGFRGSHFPEIPVTFLLLCWKAFKKVYCRGIKNSRRTQEEKQLGFQLQFDAPKQILHIKKEESGYSQRLNTARDNCPILFYRKEFLGGCSLTRKR